MTLTFRNRQLPEWWFFREQGWRTYGTSAQNGRRKISLARGIRCCSIFCSLPGQCLYIVIYTYTHAHVYIHIHTQTYLTAYRSYMKYRCYQITLRVKHFYKIDSRTKCWLDIYHWGAGLEVTGRMNGIEQNVLQSSFQTGSSGSPSYIQIVFLIAFLEETFFRNIIIILIIIYTIIIIIYINNNAIINNNYGRLQHLILLFKIPMGRRKNFF